MVRTKLPIVILCLVRKEVLVGTVVLRIEHGTNVVHCEKSKEGSSNGHSITFDEQARFLGVMHAQTVALPRASKDEAQKAKKRGGRGSGHVSRAHGIISG